MIWGCGNKYYGVGSMLQGKEHQSWGQEILILALTLVLLRSYLANWLTTWGLNFLSCKMKGLYWVIFMVSSSFHILLFSSRYVSWKCRKVTDMKRVNSLLLISWYDFIQSWSNSWRSYYKILNLWKIFNWPGSRWF